MRTGTIGTDIMGEVLAAAESRSVRYATETGRAIGILRVTREWVRAAADTTDPVMRELYLRKTDDYLAEQMQVIDKDWPGNV